MGGDFAGDCFGVVGLEDGPLPFDFVVGLLGCFTTFACGVGWPMAPLT
jgi:hypothetical protein